MQRLELDLHVGAQLAVERAQRLVEQQQMRREDERAGERHALLLAAGELSRQALGEVAELDQVEGSPHASARSRHAAVSVTSSGKAMLREHREVRKQGVALEHHAEIALAPGAGAGSVRHRAGFHHRWA